MITFSPYKGEGLTTFKKDLKYMLFWATVFFLGIYLAPLIKFGDKISISDWPIPQENSKNASFYLPDSPTPEDIQLHMYYDEYLRTYVPGVMDLILFNFSLSIDTILFGGEPSKWKYYYTLFGIIKNLFNSVTILMHVEWGYLSNFKAVYETIDSFNNWFYFAFLRFAPLYIMRNFLYLPNVTALLKLAKNLADIEIMIKLRGRKAHKIIRSFLCCAQIFTTILYGLYFIFIFFTNILSLIYGFVLGGLTNPIMFLGIYILSCFCCLPLHIIRLLQDYYSDSRRDRNSYENANLIENQEENQISINNENYEKDRKKEEDLSDPIQRKMYIERKTDERKYIFLIVRVIMILIYTTLSYEIFYFATNDWPSAARFTFNLPNLGFNIYAFDFKKKIKTNTEYVNLVLNLI